MKTKFTLVLVFSALAGSAWGQEYDDMYFTSKDRAKLEATRQEALLSQYRREDESVKKTSPVNPTDSYSGRNVNPEYSTGKASIDEAGYFVPGYRPTGVNQTITSNYGAGSFNHSYCNSCAFQNPYFGMTPGFGSPYSSFYPYSFSPFNSFGYSPGLTGMLGYSWGGGWNSGWYSGFNYGWNSGWGPVGYYTTGSPFWDAYYGYNSYRSWNPWLYGGNNYVIVTGGDGGRPVAYQKRSPRSDDTGNLVDRSRPEGGYTRTGRELSNSGGRSRADQTEYYDRGWKRDPDKNPSRAYWSGSSDHNTANSTRQSQNNGFSWGDNSGGRQRSFDDNGTFDRSSRSSFGTSGNSGGGRSSTGGGGSSGGGSRTRGRD